MNNKMFIPYWLAVAIVLVILGLAYWMLKKPTKKDSYGNFGESPFPNDKPHAWVSSGLPSPSLTPPSSQDGHTIKTTRFWDKCGCCADSAREDRGDIYSGIASCSSNQTLTATRQPGTVVREEIAQGYTL